MESVINTIKEARRVEAQKRANANITNAFVDGCKVTIRFSPIGDSKVMPTIQSMLINAFAESSALTSPKGGQA